MEPELVLFTVQSHAQHSDHSVISALGISGGGAAMCSGRSQVVQQRVAARRADSPGDPAAAAATPGATPWLPPLTPPATSCCSGTVPSAPPTPPPPLLLPPRGETAALPLVLAPLPSPLNEFRAGAAAPPLALAALTTMFTKSRLGPATPPSAPVPPPPATPPMMASCFEAWMAEGEAATAPPTLLVQSTQLPAAPLAGERERALSAVDAAAAAGVGTPT